MVIDAHAHISVWEELGIDGNVHYAVELMDHHEIDIACVSNPRSLRTDYIQGNRTVLDAMRRYPQRILGFAVANPWDGKRALKEFETCIKEFGMKGLKLHISHTKIDYHHPLTLPFIEKAIDLKVPVLVHCYDGGVSVDKVASMFPEAVIIMGHMGGFDWYDAIPVAKKHKNVYLEICGSPMEVGIIEKAVEAVGGDRVLFGTDLPLLDPVISIYKIKDADISEEDRMKIFGENMAKILNL